MKNSKSNNTNHEGKKCEGKTLAYDSVAHWSVVTPGAMRARRGTLGRGKKKRVGSNGSLGGVKSRPVRMKKGLAPCYDDTLPASSESGQSSDEIGFREMGHKQGRLTGKRESTPARSDGGGESAILADLQELNGKGGSGVKPHKTNLPASTDKSKKRKQMNSEAKSKDEKSMVTKGHSTRRKRAAVREYPELSYPRLTECGLLGDIVRKTARLELTALVKRLEQDQEIRPCLVAIVEAVKKFEAKSQKLDKLGVMIHDVKAQMQGRREKMAFLKDVVKKLEAEDLAWDEAEESIASGDLSEYNGPTSLPPNSVGNEAKEQQREVAADGSGVAQHLNELIDLMSGCESTARCFTAKLSKHASLIDQAQEVQSQLYDVYKRLKFKGYPNIDDPKSAIKAITKK